MIDQAQMAGGRDEPTVPELIAAEIGRCGPIPFARFMDIALYAPGAGYYACGASRVGKGGDFFTSASVGPAFGAALACQFEEIWELLGRPDPFWIIEQGANDGRLAADILTHAGAEFFPAIRYEIREPAPALRERQAQTLALWAGRVSWNSAPGPRKGVFFCNELLDAFPFHLLRSTGTGWEEMFVELDGGGFRFVAGAPSPGLDLPPPRPAGYLAETRPGVRGWVREIASALDPGYFFVIDYGFRDGAVKDRPGGTFAAYRNHRRHEDILADPGENDLTAHLDFTALEADAVAEGLLPYGFADQGRFLVRAAEPLLRSLDGQAGHKILRGIQTLFHPGVMGSSFHVLGFRTASAPARGLRGFGG